MNNIFYEKYRPLLKEKFDIFAKAMETPLRKSIRVNTKKISVEDFKKYAISKKWILDPIPWIAEGCYIDRENKSNPIGKDILHIFGYFYIQEASSMLPPIALNINKDDVILDMCASPGSKTTQINNMIDDTNVVIANEISTARISALKYNIENQLAINTIITNIDGMRFGSNFPEVFDKILLDAPCSSEGTYRKDKKIADICSSPKVSHKMHNIQTSLLNSGIQALKTGGEIVYSTCTLTLEENEKVIEEISTKYQDKIQVINPNIPNCKYDEIYKNTMRVWPHLNDSEGFFVAKIKKIDSTYNPKKQTNSNNLSRSKTSQNIKLLSKNEKQSIINTISDIYGIPQSMFDTYIFLSNKKEISITPQRSYIFTNKYRFYNTGYIITKISNSGELFFTHLFTQLFGKYAIQNTFALDDQQTFTYMQGNDISDISISNIINRQIILTYQGLIIGKGLYIPNEQKIKNQFPRNKIFI